MLLLLFFVYCFCTSLLSFSPLSPPLFSSPLSYLFSLLFLSPSLPVLLSSPLQPSCVWQHKKCIPYAQPLSFKQVSPLERLNHSLPLYNAKKIGSVPHLCIILNKLILNKTSVFTFITFIPIPCIIQWMKCDVRRSLRW